MKLGRFLLIGRFKKGREEERREENFPFGETNLGLEGDTHWGSTHWMIGRNSEN